MVCCKKIQVKETQILSTDIERHLFNKYKFNPILMIISTKIINSRKQLLIQLLMITILTSKKPRLLLCINNKISHKLKLKPILIFNHRQLTFKIHQIKLTFKMLQIKLMLMLNPNMLELIKIQNIVILHTLHHKLISHTLNINHKKLMFNPHQKRLMFNKVQNKYMFNPNPKSLMEINHTL